MEDNVLKSYVPLVKFLAGVLGSNCEVVLHDLINIEQSIVAIENNHISGREIGAPLTDLTLKILNQKSTEKEFIHNYTGKTKDGKKLRSSTYFIKNNAGNVIGLLCINIDIADFISTKNFLEELITGVKTLSNNEKKEQDSPEYLSDSIEDLMHAIIEKTLLEYNIPPERMIPEEKMEIVSKLNEKGVFLLKGAVFEVAKYLKTSEATIYRYLNKN